MIKIFSFTSRVAFVSAGLLVLCAIGGCNSSNTKVSSPADTAKQRDDMIRNIENNPHMPADAKAEAIASLRNPGNGAQQQVAPQAAPPSEKK